MASLGRPKVESAAAAIHALNPDTVVRAHDVRLDAGNVLALVEDYDVVCDGTDNFDTRFLLADACVLARRTLVSAAVLRFEGQLSTFKPHADPDGPCYRCLHPVPPPPGLVPACSEAGVMGAVTGVMGTLQATEAVKEIVGIGEGLSGRLLVWDALAVRFRTVRLRRDPDCALCGPNATIRSLSAHVGAAHAGAMPVCDAPGDGLAPGPGAAAGSGDAPGSSPGSMATRSGTADDRQAESALVAGPVPEAGGGAGLSGLHGRAGGVGAL